MYFSWKNKLFLQDSSLPLLVRNPIKQPGIKPKKERFALQSARASRFSEEIFLCGNAIWVRYRVLYRHVATHTHAHNQRSFILSDEKTIANFFFTSARRNNRRYHLFCIPPSLLATRTLAQGHKPTPPNQGEQTTP